MRFSILKASVPANVARWNWLINELPLPLRDIHHTPAYGIVQEKLGGEAMLALLETDDGFVMQPFMRRLINLNVSAQTDLCSPYGYGGPVTNIAGPMARCDSGYCFGNFLSEWCIDNEAVTEFCYLHPLMVTRQFAMISAPLRLLKQTVVIDLTKLPADEFADQTMVRRIRRGIKKAKTRAALISMTGDNVARSNFATLYDKSMADKNASARWRFPRGYLDAHYDELAARLFYVGDGDGARMLMVIGGYGTAYAHFLGSNGEGRDHGLDELLYFEAALALRRDGYERFHLGGGLTGASDDPLLAFKAGFSELRFPVYCYQRIFDQDAYAELSARKIALEHAKLGRESRLSFFPVYRRETI